MIDYPSQQGEDVGDYPLINYYLCNPTTHAHTLMHRCWNCWRKKRNTVLGRKRLGKDSLAKRTANTHISGAKGETITNKVPVGGGMLAYLIWNLPSLSGHLSLRSCPHLQCYCSAVWPNGQESSWYNKNIRASNGCGLMILLTHYYKKLSGVIDHSNPIVDQWTMINTLREYFPTWCSKAKLELQWDGWWREPRVYLVANWYCFCVLRWYQEILTCLGSP